MACPNRCAPSRGHTQINHADAAVNEKPRKCWRCPNPVWSVICLHFHPIHGARYPARGAHATDDALATGIMTGCWWWCGDGGQTRAIPFPLPPNCRPQHLSPIPGNGTTADLCYLSVMSTTGQIFVSYTSGAFFKKIKKKP
jgi:hypothetical protein